MPGVRRPRLRLRLRQFPSTARLTVQRVSSSENVKVAAIDIQRVGKHI